MDWLPYVYETNLHAIVAEWEKKYRNTFMHLNGTLVRATMVESPYLYFTDKQGSNLRIKVDTDQVLDTSFPKIGCFTYEKSLAVFSRVPARQFKKGLCPENCRMYYPFRGSRIQANIPCDFGALSQAYKKGYVDPKKLIMRLLDKDADVYAGGAISEDWGMQKHPNKEEHLILFFREFAVGEITSDGKCSPIVPTFVQELQDFNKKYLLDMKIV